MYVIRQFLSAARLYQAVFPLSRSTMVWLCPLQPLRRIVQCTDYPDFLPAMFVPSVLQLLPTLVYGYQNTILTSYAHSSSDPAGHTQLHGILYNQIGYLITHTNTRIYIYMHVLVCVINNLQNAR